MTPLDAMKQALEALIYAKMANINIANVTESITNLRSAIAEMEPAEPTRCKHDVWIADHCYQCEMEKAEPVAEYHWKPYEMLYGIKLRPTAKIKDGDLLFTRPVQSRDAIIEECAAVCMRECSVMEEPHEFERCAAAIRALKGK